ncbi:hypothetical protein pb186bvf_000733 [Paramecium bursaria]
MYENQEKINQFVSDKMNMLMSESVYRYRKSAVLIETERFNESKIQEDISKSILIKLLYLINKGDAFEKKELEELSIRVTKLLQSQDSELRRLTYKILKVKILKQQEIIMPSNIQNMTIQSIFIDLSSNKWNIKLNAMRMISVFKDQSNVLLLERDIICNMINNRGYIGLKRAYFQFRIDCCTQLIQKLPQPCIEVVIRNITQIRGIQQKQYFLCTYIILASLIKRYSQIYQDSLRNHQLEINSNYNYADFEIYRKNHIFQSKVLKECKINIIQSFIEFSLQQIQYKDPIIFLQACKTLIEIRSLTNNELEPMMSIILMYLSPKTDNILTYATIRLLNRLIIYWNRQQLITIQIHEALQKLTYSDHQSISSQAIQFCISINKSFKADDLALIYYKINETRSQMSFLQGLYEFLNRHYILGDKILEFLFIILQQKVIDDLVFQTFDLVVCILKTQRQFKNQSIGTILWIAEKFKIVTKQRIVKEINQILFQQPTCGMNNEQITLSFQNLVKQYQLYEPKLHYDNSTIFSLPS